MSIVTVIDWASAVADALIFFLSYEAFLSRRTGRSPWFYGIGWIALASGIAVCNRLFMFSSFNVMGMCILGIAAAYCYEGKGYTRCLSVLLAMLVLMLTELCTLYMLTFLFDETVEAMVNIPTNRFMGIVLSKAMGIGVANGVRLHTRKNRYIVNRNYWKIFSLLSANLILVSFFMFKVSYGSDSIAYNNMAVLGILCLTLSTIFAMFLYEKYGVQERALEAEAEQKNMLELHVKYLDELLAKQEALKRFQHDFSNQLIALRGYLIEGKNKEAMQYVDRLQQSVTQTSVAIDTGNTALDAVLTTKKALAESKGISCHFVLQIPQALSMDPLDLCVIFGNVLDNAIEACQRAPSPEKTVRLFLVLSGQKLVCTVTNTIDSAMPCNLKTDKPDKSRHGLGLGNVEAALAKYHCKPIIEVCESCFRFKFVIYMPK